MYYSFNYGNVHYVMITLEAEYKKELEKGKQRDWLEEDLEEANENRENLYGACATPLRSIQMWCL